LAERLCKNFRRGKDSCSEVAEGGKKKLAGKREEGKNPSFSTRLSWGEKKKRPMICQREFLREARVGGEKKNFLAERNHAYL